MEHLGHRTHSLPRLREDVEADERIVVVLVGVLGPLVLSTFDLEHEARERLGRRTIVDSREVQAQSTTVRTLGLNAQDAITAHDE